MSWYYLLFIVVAYGVGIYLHYVYKDYLKHSHHNDSWKNRDK
ncbi:hypothetical protein [Flavobacterium sp. 102]|nr:hypothetical protein [Flavobacterium sp. 102]